MKKTPAEKARDKRKIKQPKVGETGGPVTVTGGSPNQSPIPLGWRCPYCNVVYAPSVDRCFCKKTEVQRDEEYERMVRERLARLREERDRVVAPPPPYIPWYHPPTNPGYWQPTVYCGL